MAVHQALIDRTSKDDHAVFSSNIRDGTQNTAARCRAGSARTCGRAGNFDRYYVWNLQKCMANFHAARRTDAIGSRTGFPKLHCSVGNSVRTTRGLICHWKGHEIIYAVCSSSEKPYDLAEEHGVRARMTSPAHSPMFWLYVRFLRGKWELGKQSEAMLRTFPHSWAAAMSFLS